MDFINFTNCSLYGLGLQTQFLF